jgi:ABC-type uncharacterized transport system ATPase subunit
MPSATRNLFREKVPGPPKTFVSGYSYIINSGTKPTDRKEENRMNAQAPAVEIMNVTKTFQDVTAVDNLSLNIPKSCVYGFIGPNGSGKTTTLRMIMNIFYPDNGTIRVFGEERTQAHTDRIGYLPEERGLYKKMKVRSLLRFYGNMKNGKNVNKQVDT